MFGNSPAPQNEKTPFAPESPYAEAKLRAHQDFIVNKRNTTGSFTASGILFNHESERRGKQFVTRKITYSFAKIHAGLQECLELGNLDAVRDWGHAEDYVKAMHLILQNDKPEDFVIASGKSHSVREFCEIAARHFNFDIIWEGEKEEESGIDNKTGNVIIKVNPKFYRPREVNHLSGDPSKAKEILGWKPQISFEEMVMRMAVSDSKIVAKEYSL